MSCLTKSDTAVQSASGCQTTNRSRAIRLKIRFCIVIFPLLGCCSAAKGDCDSCLIELSRHVSLYQQITVADSNNFTIQGNLIKIEIENSQIALSQSRSRRLLQYNICRDNVTQLGFRKRGKPNLYLIVAGFFIGQIIGKLVENLLDPGYDIRMEILPFRKPIGNEDGTWVGAISGFGAGLFASMLIPSGRSILCRRYQDSGRK